MKNVYQYDTFFNIYTFFNLFIGKGVDFFIGK